MNGWERAMYQMLADRDPATLTPGQATTLAGLREKAAAPDDGITLLAHAQGGEAPVPAEEPAAPEPTEHMKFVKWLVEHGRLSEDLKDGEFARDAIGDLDADDAATSVPAPALVKGPEHYEGC